MSRRRVVYSVKSGIGRSLDDPTRSSVGGCRRWCRQEQRRWLAPFSRGSGVAHRRGRCVKRSSKGLHGLARGRIVVRAHDTGIFLPSPIAAADLGRTVAKFHELIIGDDLLGSSEAVMQSMQPKLICLQEVVRRELRTSRRQVVAPVSARRVPKDFAMPCSRRRRADAQFIDGVRRVCSPISRQSVLLLRSPNVYQPAGAAKVRRGRTPSLLAVIRIRL